MKDHRIVYGGGAAETACSLAVSQEADKVRKIKNDLIIEIHKVKEHSICQCKSLWTVMINVRERSSSDIFISDVYDLNTVKGSSRCNQVACVLLIGKQ